MHCKCGKEIKFANEHRCEDCYADSIYAMSHIGYSERRPLSPVSVSTGSKTGRPKKRPVIYSFPPKKLSVRNG